MPIPALALKVGAGILGSIFGGGGARKERRRQETERKAAIEKRLGALRTALKIQQPTRDVGARAIGELRESVRPGGGRIAEFERVGGRRDIGKTLSKYGFSPGETGAFQERFEEERGAREFADIAQRRRGLADVGQTFGSAGERITGATGGTIADLIASRTSPRQYQDLATIGMTKGAILSRGLERGIGDIVTSRELNRRAVDRPSVVNPRTVLNPRSFTGPIAE